MGSTIFHIQFCDFFGRASFCEAVGSEGWREPCFELKPFDRVGLKTVQQGDFDNCVGYVHPDSARARQKALFLFSLPEQGMGNNPGLIQHAGC